MDPRHAVLFEPIRIGPKTLPNRFYQVPHASGFGIAEPRSQAAFRGIKAAGGWGGVCVEYAPVSADAEETPAVAADFWEPADAAALTPSVEAIHAHGALAGLELFHGGSASENGKSRSVRVAPSQVGSELMWAGLAKEMDADDIRRIQRAWVDAAVRARDIGFDIVYVYGAHGYLLTQFFSPATNRRTDGYGGSLTGRARFWLETLAAVRAAIGADCAIASRIPVHGGTGLPGIEVEEMLALIAMADDLVDLFDVNVGGWPEDSGTSRYFPEGHQRQWTDRVKGVTTKPVVGVGRYTSPDLMADIVRSGRLDIIGAARPAIADPFLPRKIADGRLDEIRECTGSNVCIAREESLRHVGCIQNPTAGEEFRRGWHPETFAPATDPDRGVLVVGAGPAGSECAMVLGKRGFAVHLVEASNDLGGRLSWMRRLPTLGDWGRIVDWRSIQLAKLPGVEVITGHRMSAEDVVGYGAAIVVVATGSRWRGDGVQPHGAADVVGADAALAHIATPEQVMIDGKRPPGRRVVVYDTDGYVVGPGLAEQLAGEGHEVDLVTCFPVVSPGSDPTLEGEFLRQHLHERGVRMHRGVTLTAASVDGVAGLDEYGEPWSLATDGVVLVTQQCSDDALYGELTNDRDRLAAVGIEAVFRVGDAVAPMPISEAIFDAHRLAREIDQPDPAVPLPYRRERVGL